MVVLKSYFDGGNEADGSQYSIVTLAAMSANRAQWKVFELEWGKVLRKHNAPYLHTTDAVGLSGVFSKRNGWTDAKVEMLIQDCVFVIEKCAAVRSGGEIVRTGLRPATVSVLLEDFRRALEQIPDLGTVEHVCAIQCVGFCLAYGHVAGASQFQFFFDQGEPFYGHICDRLTNKKSLAWDAAQWQKIVHRGESDMRIVPALQAADLLAWSINHAHEDRKIRFDWQHRLMSIDREQEWFDYSTLKHPNREIIDRVKTWKLPKRKANRL